MADQATLELLRQVLGYTDAQWETWKSNPRNLKIADNLENFQKYKMVAEVKSASGCAVGHKAGDQIVFGADGSLLCKESPERVCAGLLSPLGPYVMLMLDKVANGEDPTGVAFSKVHCTDVGLDNGGWGEVIAEVRVEKV
jgi:uncharacterized repeat protein (TIGR04076 family)